MQIAFFNITETKWELNQDVGVHMREVNLVCKVTDVPFKDRTRVHKILTYKKVE